MIYFKSCPRCSGDQILHNDEYGNYIICLACGYVAYPEVPEEDLPAATSRSDQSKRVAV